MFRSKNIKNKTNIDKIFETFALANPNPVTELYYTNNFTLLVAVVLSARMTDKGVNKVTPKLFIDADTPEKMRSLGIEKLKEHIKTIGLYPTKAKNIIALSEILIRDYKNEVPSNIEDLIKLPGVGRKTANVVLNCAFGIATIPVDTHVQRVSHRIGIAKTNNPDSIETELLKVIPSKWLNNAHHWLVLHGRYVCKARKPLCNECIITQWCDAFKHDLL